MTTRTIFTRWLGLQKPMPASTALTVHAPAEIIVQERPLPIPHQPTPIIIDLPPIQTETQTDTLSNFLRIGRQYHPICRDKFVDKVVTGFYYYEQRVEYHTCTIAAAYAGAFGGKSVEESGFSRSMAIWKLKQRLGYNLEELKVTGPTGRNNSLANELISLTDFDGWNRKGIAEWLISIGL